MNENKNMATMSFEGQHDSLLSNLEVNKEENLSYNEEITSRGNEELEKFQKVEIDSQTLETLVVKEDQPTSSESHEQIKEKVVNTIPKMAPWGEMHEELKVEEVTLMLGVELRRKKPSVSW